MHRDAPRNSKLEVVRSPIHSLMNTGVAYNYRKQQPFYNTTIFLSQPYLALMNLRNNEINPSTYPFITHVKEVITQALTARRSISNAIAPFSYHFESS